eukprot:scaffold700_cov560-Prasinococcus_capsulatus_cf.AAC.7
MNHGCGRTRLFIGPGHSRHAKGRPLTHSPCSFHAAEAQRVVRSWARGGQMGARRSAVVRTPAAATTTLQPPRRSPEMMMMGRGTRSSGVRPRQHRPAVPREGASPYGGERCRPCPANPARGRAP